VTLPLRDATGVTAPLGDISTTLDRALIEVRESAASLEDAVGRASRALERLFRPDRVDRRVRYAVELIATARGRVPIETVAARTGMTRRHLERRFSEDVGLSPKRLARIARFQHALRVLDDVPAAGRGTTTAAECGYADQAHFIREFRSLAGCAPGSHLLRRAELTEFFIRRE
jgi:AraC-like DNA-binding protein